MQTVSLESCSAKYDVASSWLLWWSRGGGEWQRAARVLLGGRRRAILESEGASSLLATCPSSQRQFRILSTTTNNYIYHALLELFALLLQITKLHFQQDRVNYCIEGQRVKRLMIIHRERKRGAMILLFCASGLCKLSCLTVIFGNSHQSSRL